MTASLPVDSGQARQRCPDRIGVGPYLAIALICLLAAPFALIDLSAVAIGALLATVACVVAAESRRRAIINASLVWAVVFLVLVVLVLNVSRAGEAARRAQCRNRLKQIGLALLNYQDEYATPPPAYIADAGGKPLHSWRVLLLPFLDEQRLYNEYDFSDPWDGPNNRLLADKLPSIYTCPRDFGKPSNTTSYVAVVEADTPWRLRESITSEEMRNVTPNVIQIVETTDADIQWTEPRDFSSHLTVADLNLDSRHGISSRHLIDVGWFYRTTGMHVLYADGSVDLLTDEPRLNRAKVLGLLFLAMAELVFVVSCLVLLGRPNMTRLPQDQVAL